MLKQYIVSFCLALNFMKRYHPWLIWSLETCFFTQPYVTKIHPCCHCYVVFLFVLILQFSINISIAYTMIYQYLCHWAFRVFPVFVSMSRAVCKHLRLLACMCRGFRCVYTLKGRTATTAVLWCMKSFNFTKECERASRVAVSISTPTRRAEKILSVHIFANSLYFQTSIFFFANFVFINLIYFLSILSIT